MSLARGFLCVCISGVVFGLLGAALGQQVGTHIPDYYHTLLTVPDGANMPLLGTALGLIQGLLVGLGVGLVLTLSVTWYEINRLKYASTEHTHSSTH